MPQPRKLDETKLLLWDVQGLSAVDMQRRLADEGTMASLDLIRCACGKHGGRPKGSGQPRSRSGSPRPPTGGRAS